MDLPAQRWGEQAEITQLSRNPDPAQEARPLAPCPDASSPGQQAPPSPHTEPQRGPPSSLPFWPQPWLHSQVLQVGQARKRIVLDHGEGVECEEAGKGASKKHFPESLPLSNILTLASTLSPPGHGHTHTRVRARTRQVCAWIQMLSQTHTYTRVCTQPHTCA